MMLTTHQAAHLIGAQTSGADLPFLRVVTDTRLVQAGDLFVALKGDRFDAHDFVAEALAAGAVAALVREHFPQLTVVARARNVTHYLGLRALGITLIERETLDSALMSGRSVLETLGFEPHQARTLALKFRRHSIEQMHALAPHYGDQARLIALAKAGRQQLEDMFAQDRAQRTEHPGGGGWHAADDTDAPPAR